MIQDEVRWYTSKVDWPLACILVAVPLMQVSILFSAVLRGDEEGIVATLVGAGFVALIYGLLVIPVRYGIAGDSLLVHFGVVRQRIPFEAIREVYPTRSPLSSPALSFDRLAIKTGRGPLSLTLISPNEREEFLETLSTRAGLAWDGRRWLRKDGPPPGRGDAGQVR